MRKSDKLKNFKKANLLAENRYLESKGFEVEPYNEIDETPMDVNEVVDPKTEEIELKRVKNDLKQLIHNFLFHSKNPEGYLSVENRLSLGTNQITPRQLDIRHDNVIEILTEYIENTLKTNKSGLDYDSVDYVKNWAHKEAPELDNIQGGELDEEYLSEGEDNLGLYKAEMKKTGDYGWTYNNGQKERAADEEIRNKKAKEGFKHNFTQKYMEQTINTTDGVYTFENIKFVSNYGDYEVIFTRPSNDNEILLWLVYDVTNGYYIKDNKKDIKLTDEDSKNKVKEMLSYNEFIQPEN